MLHKWYWRWQWNGLRERVQTAVAWRVPRWLVYWTVIRAFAHGTTGQYGTTHPDSLGYAEVLRRWETPHERGA